jgi:Uncharacterized protein family UPF0029
MALKRKLFSQPLGPVDPSEYSMSESIIDRSSTFTGYFSPTLARNQLQSLPEIANATHRICAWRVRSKQKTLTPGSQPTLDIGHDDDGEKWAGKKLENLLVQEKAIGVVAVARWYGGTNLGPVRFTHIEECAKEAIQKWRNGRTAATADTKKRRLGEELGTDIANAGIPAVQAPSSQIPSSQPGPQAMRPEEVQRQRRALVKELQDRDSSIAVLRKLLDDKKAKFDHFQSPPASSAVSKSLSPSKVPDYSSLTLVRLQAMEKARDASISYLLKELDKVDKEQAEDDELDAAFKEVNDRKELEAAWNTMEQELAKEKQDTAKSKGKAPSNQKAPQRPKTPDPFEGGDDDDVFDEAWKANEQLLTPKKSKGVQVNDGDLPESPARRKD